MKVANSYASLLRGVSQQVPQDRSEGQHTEQINMLSDPINGLARRHGSVWEAEQHLVDLLPEELDSYVADTANWTSLDFDSGGKEYVILARRGARPATANPLPLLLAYNKTDKTFLSLVRNVTDAALDLLEAAGISALTGVGRYLFMAGNGIATSGSSTEQWNTATNLSRGVVWVRGGAYSRTYTMKVRRQSGVVTAVSYTTPSSSYQGVLDTSDILTADPDYTKKVNDRVNSYNAAVTQWIGTAAGSIQPAAIATALTSAYNGVFPGHAFRVGAHVCFDTVATIQSIEVDDGGDGSLIRGVADEVGSVDEVSVVHFVGKVVKVRTRNSSEAFYLTAVAKDSLATGYTEVTWVEGAGVTQAITSGLYSASVSGSSIYIASTPALLTAILAGTHPTFTTSGAGDTDSATAPFFVGRSITYLGTFQNRLLVGSGGVLAVSKTEDYLNFFRSTVLTLPADDPFEMLPQGSEDDELRYSTLYDQDLVIFGKKRQYVISGKSALTPTSANMAVMASYEGVADAAPMAAGGFIFYAKRGPTYSSLHQIQPGQIQDSPESFPASSQIDTYLQGGAIELASITGSPSALFMRTTGYRNGLYTFAYLDKQDGRKMDSWNKWEFNEVLGSIIGFSVTSAGLLVFFLREGSLGEIQVVADLCTLSTGLSSRPYLDSNRYLASEASTISGANSAYYSAAYDDSSIRHLIGAPLEDVAALMAAYPGLDDGLVVGANQTALFTPTNPFMRDGKGKAILSGRLAVGKVVVAFKDSTGFDSTVGYMDQVFTVTTFNGRILGDPTNVIGIEPISTGQHNVPVGRETRQYVLTLMGRKWFPLTVTALEWVGQFFNRTQRY